MLRTAFKTVLFFSILFLSNNLSAQAWQMMASDAELSVFATQENCGGDNYILLSYENKNPTVQDFRYQINYNASGVFITELQEFTGLAGDDRFLMTCNEVANHFPFGIIALPLNHVVDFSKLDITIIR